MAETLNRLANMYALEPENISIFNSIERELDRLGMKRYSEEFTVKADILANGLSLPGVPVIYNNEVYYSIENLKTAEININCYLELKEENRELSIELGNKELLLMELKEKDNIFTSFSIRPDKDYNRYYRVCRSNMSGTHNLNVREKTLFEKVCEKYKDTVKAHSVVSLHTGTYLISGRVRKDDRIVVSDNLKNYIAISKVKIMDIYTLLIIVSGIIKINTQTDLFTIYK